MGDGRHDAGLAHATVGADVARGADGELRYEVMVAVESWTGQG